MKIQQAGPDVRVLQLDRFSLADTLECGQCFRWNLLPDGHYAGVIKSTYVEVGQDGGVLTFFHTSEEYVHGVLVEYFDLARDYSAIARYLVALEPKLLKAEQYAPGIRILAQEPWEALCSFIISQNNNIPRIKGIISRLCEGFGKPVEHGYAFPDAERIAGLEIEDLAPLRSGFRAKYILDAARKITEGIVNLKELKTAELEYARTQLMKICGVGPKVAECTLLYGLGRLEAFPVDVWMKRVMEEYFPDGSPITQCPYAGIAQQYLFHKIRTGEVDS